MIIRVAILLPILCVGSVSLFGGQRDGRDTEALSAVDSALSRKIVARVGPKTITAREFQIAYNFGPAFPKREKDSKHKFLQYMIDEKLLALDAADQGGLSNHAVKRSVDELQHDLATEQLFREEVLRNVRISQEELRDAVEAQRVHYSLRWIYAATREEIDEYARELASGSGFDTIFRASLDSSVTTDQRSWETSRFKVKMLRPALAMVADTLKPGRSSAPLEGPDGWYILSLDSLTFDPMSTGSAEAQQIHDAKEALTQQKSDSLSDQYIDRMMREHAPVIQRKAFDILSVSLAHTWLPENLRKSLLSALSIDREIALAAAGDPRRYDTEPLVKMSDRALPLKKFIAWYDDRSTILKLRGTSIRSFQSSLEQLVWRMVRDGLLIERAQKRHLDRREEVKDQKGWWEDKILYSLEKENLGALIKVNEENLKHFFDENRHRYARTKGDTLTFEGTRDEVRRDFVTQELTKVLLHRLIALKRKYPISIAEDVLAAVPVDSENDPKAIDVYVAKKGGTFPHPAFPTIDPDWQAWE